MTAFDKNSVRNTLSVSFTVCLFCAFLTALAAVLLKSRQDTNTAYDRNITVLKAAGLLPERPDKANVAEIFKNIRPVMINLSDGKQISAKWDDAQKFDPESAGRSEDNGYALSADADVAGIKRMTKLASVFEVFGTEPDNTLKKIILPFYGAGLWGIMRGYLAFEPDAETISQIVFYDHKETPGLGGEVDNPKWQSLWKGRKAYRGDEIALRVIKSAGKETVSPYEVDGISGATITSRSVSEMIRFWLGTNGYFNYLRRMQHTAAGKD